MLNKFSEKSQKIITLSESIAFDLGHSSVGTKHLLLAFLRFKDCKIKKILDEYNITYELVKDEVISLFGKKSSKPFYMDYSASLKNVLENAITLSKKKSEERVSVDQLSLALLSLQNSSAIELLNKLKVNVNEVVDELTKQVKRSSELDSISDLVNLNQKALKNPPILINREKEMQNLIDVLLRKQKPNAIVVGKSGVGKTALVEYLAHLININNVPEQLKNKNIYELDIASIVAGTKYRGEFEEKLKKILKKIKDDSNAIIFIDEIHNIIGAGGAEGAIDASNIIKPYLSRGDICCIGATTYDEYIKLIEKEKALERRFQLVFLEEPSYQDTIKIIKGISPSFCKYHNLEISDEIINDLVYLTSHYVFERNFPDKAIDVLDISCVLAKNNKQTKVDKQNIIDTIESNYHVSIEVENKADTIQKKLNEKLFGQEKAINDLCKQIKYIELGLNEINRPLGVFLLVGATGVGKTECAKQIAKYYFGSEKKYIKLDMSEYSENVSVSKLIGSPPGYVGFEKQSLLVDHIRNNPHSVVVLDEVEKASRDVLDVFLNVFDEGYFYDSNKRKIDFSNSIIIMTSNLGFSEAMFHQNKIGYMESKYNIDDINKVIQRHFRPEFINRIDEIIYFDCLEKEAIEKITNAYLDLYKDKIEFTDNEKIQLLNSILNDNEALKYGARGIKRKIKKEIIKKIEEKMYIKNN